MTLFSTRRFVFTLLFAAAALISPPVSLQAQSAPVVLELFTSQGCSSCPSADRLLSKLAQSKTWEGKVLPLAFHVDYWNYIGWTDPFSSREWSERQERYAAVFDSDRIYTPQLVFNGSLECVGSDEAAVGRLLRKLSAVSAAFEVAVSARWAAAGLTISASAHRLAPADGSEEAPSLLVAITESGLSTPVGRGENARRTLHNDFVVRRLLRVGPTGSLEVPVDPDWGRDRLSLVAFVQEPRSRRILGAAAAVIEPAPAGSPRR